MANITSTEAAGFIPEIWLAEALGRLKAHLTFQRVIAKDNEYTGGGVFQVGDILKLPRRGALTVADKAEGSNYAVLAPTADTVDLTLNKHKHVTFGIESRALATANQNVIGGYVEDAVSVMAEQIDSDIAALYSGVGGGNTITGTGAITEANVISMRKLFTDNKVPANKRKYAVVNSTQAGALLAIERFTSWDKLGSAGNIADGRIGGQPGPSMDGSLGRIYGIEFAESQLIPVSTTHRNLAFVPEAFMFASRPLENPDGQMGVKATVMTDPASGITMRLLHSYQHLMGAHVVTLDVLYGVALARPEWVIQLTTTA